MTFFATEAVFFRFTFIENIKANGMIVNGSRMCAEVHNK